MTESDPTQEASPVIPPLVPNKKGRFNKPLLIIGLVLGSLVVCIGGIAVLACLWIFAAKDQPITEHDRLLVPSVGEIAEYYEDFEPSQQYVSFSKERYLDGSVEISYEYDSPLDDEPYIAVTVNHEISRSDADMIFGIEWSAMRVGLNIYDSDFELRENNGFYRVGDHSRFGDIMLDGEMMGHVLVSRKGDSVYAFTISGYIMDDAEIWHEMFDERINQLLTAEP